MPNLRRSILQQAFELLYGPLAGFHEPMGRLLMGRAWDGRRHDVLDSVADGPLLDLGCGEGRLLSAAQVRNVFAIGIDPSPAMAARANARGGTVIRASANALPLSNASVQVVIATYPGSWIYDEQAMSEVARVLKPHGQAFILLGGTYQRGPFAWLRRVMARIAYGNATATPSDLPEIPQLTGAVVSQEDRWGTANLWIAVRSD